MEEFVLIGTLYRGRQQDDVTSLGYGRPPIPGCNMLERKMSV